ncbi:transposase-like protein [Streptomyces sp. B3I8]|nr:transposase-like protein [Streptomyces sp. B3I8]
MDLIGDLAAIRIPLPQPGDVTPQELCPDALAEAEQARADYAFAVEAQHDVHHEDPLLIALGNARATREAADREIRHLLAYGREFHADRPYKLEPLAQAGGMSPSGIRTAYGSSEIQSVARQIGRAPDGRRARPPGRTGALMTHPRRRPAAPQACTCLSPWPALAARPQAPNVAVPRPYPKEFREDVVRVARNREPGVTLEQIAADFGVHPITLSKWLRRADTDEGARSATASDESAELREAGKRIRLLEQENEVLRRAAVCLSQANLPSE